jgi:hypothetical protein
MNSLQFVSNCYLSALVAHKYNIVGLHKFKGDWEQMLLQISESLYYGSTTGT